MKKELLASLFVFGVIVAALFWLHKVFLDAEGVAAEGYWIAFVPVFVGALVVGYIFLGQILEIQRRHERRLEHLVRETLHEINLPLSTIEANVQMLRSSCDTDKAARRLGRIGDALKRLQRLYRVLAYELKKEFAPPEREEFDLCGVLGERAEWFASLGRSPIEVACDPLQVRTDRIGFEQTIDNLLENALKYSPADEPVTVRLRGTRLEIADRGKGMDEGELLRVFERYYQADGAVEGEGIGLSIVKRYCDTEGIGLQIRSRKGEGTVVTLDLSRIAKRATISS